MERNETPTCGSPVSGDAQSVIGDLALNQEVPAAKSDNEIVRWQL